MTNETMSMSKGMAVSNGRGGHLYMQTNEVKNFGSARQSVEMHDWRGFRSLSQFDSRSRRRCGNGETRVLCGFPSSKGGQNRCGGVLHHPALGASFPQRGPVYRPFCREWAVWATDGAEMRAFQKAA